ncbi:MAG: M56 family metallopeptidase [Pseudomonadota bacterium]|nr:M56 family metallopeptidase [Pseudomonadota bacterium]
MNSFEVIAAACLAHGWRLVLAFTAATLCVALLRRPCRRLFGAERACQLWLLPPLAMLASQWPHGAVGVADDAPLPALVYLITSAGLPTPSHSGAVESHSWLVVATCAWGLGMLVVAWRAIRAQRRFRDAFRDATPVGDGLSSTPLMRATRPGVGPALVGAWRTRIVIPVDFDTRYDPVERALILAHERMHARRHDGLGSLAAQVVLAVFWFNPLAWWALGALRHDQELACDAAVLLQHRSKRRVYANAMLKTQPSAHQLPVGCCWSPRHPITERIAMLKQSPPSHRRARLGLAAGVVLGILVTGAVYAASRPAEPVAATPSPSDAAGQYQLDIMVAWTSSNTAGDHAERTTGGICMKPGGPGGVITDTGWQLQAKVIPLQGGRVSVALDLTTVGKPMASPRLEGPVGQPLLAEFNDADGVHTYSVDVTPLVGCPARLADNGAAARLTLIKRTVKNQPVRDVIESMAQRAGLEVLNPQDLTTRWVTLNFDQIPAERALRLMADIDGKQAIFHGKQVRFVAK